MTRTQAVKPIQRGVVYARFSSDMQREESIEAQVRATKEYALKNNIIIIGEYADRAKSATTDNRPQFQSMINDSLSGSFNVVLVHKLDRFARNRYDSIGYKRRLKKNGVSLISVTEQFDSDSPESIILESVIEGMNEYYSKNLAREVRKGQRENALKSMWTGGLPPYGYQVDKLTKKLIVSQIESDAVKLIFDRFVCGASYLAIAEELTRLGYRTKRGGEFTKSSFHNMLKNEVYIGNYVYNKSAEKDLNCVRNGHKYKPESEWIRNVGAVEALIDKETFVTAQKILEKNKKTFPRGGLQSIETYLLSGKIVCGECGSKLIGDRRGDTRRLVNHVKYVCNNYKRRGKNGCPDFRMISRDALECFVLQSLAKLVFYENNIDRVVKYHNSNIIAEYAQVEKNISKIDAQLEKCNADIEKVVEIIMTTESQSFMQRLEQLEKMQKELKKQKGQLEMNAYPSEVSREDVKNYFELIKSLLISNKKDDRQRAVELCVKKIIVNNLLIIAKFTLIPQKFMIRNFDWHKKQISQSDHITQKSEKSRIYEVLKNEKTRDKTSIMELLRENNRGVAHCDTTPLFGGEGEI